MFSQHREAGTPEDSKYFIDFIQSTRSIQSTQIIQIIQTGNRSSTSLEGGREGLPKADIRTPHTSPIPTSAVQQ